MKIEIKREDLDASVADIVTLIKDSANASDTADESLKYSQAALNSAKALHELFLLKKLQEG